jgi:hypothetical protein
MTKSSIRLMLFRFFLTVFLIVDTSESDVVARLTRITKVGDSVGCGHTLAVSCLLKGKMRLYGGTAASEENPPGPESSDSAFDLSHYSFHLEQNLINLTVRYQEDGCFVISSSTDTRVEELRQNISAQLPPSIYAWCGSDFELSLNARDSLERNLTLAEAGVIQNDQIFVLPRRMIRAPSTRPQLTVLAHTSSNAAYIVDLSSSDHDHDAPEASRAVPRLQEVTCGIDHGGVCTDDTDELDSNALPLPSELRIANHPDGLNASIVILPSRTAVGAAWQRPPQGHPPPSEPNGPGPPVRRATPARSENRPEIAAAPVGAFAGRTSDGRILCSDPAAALELEEALRRDSDPGEGRGAEEEGEAAAGGTADDEGAAGAEGAERLMDLCDELVLVWKTWRPFP